MDSGAIAQQLQQYDQNKVTSTDALNDALKQYGVPEIRNTVSGLRTTLANTQNAYNAVDPSVTGRTQGSLVTEAQRTKQVSNERAPIAGQISDQSKALGQNTQDLNDALGQANTLATNEVHDYESGRSALQDQYNMTYKREQDTAAAEAQRQAAARVQANEDRNYQLSASKASGNSATAPTPGSSQRNDGGFNFTDANGKAISARLYAQLTGTNFNTLLKKMASGGDKGAQDVLKNGGSAKSYKALTWN